MKYSTNLFRIIFLFQVVLFFFGYGCQDYLTYSCGAWTNSTYHVRYATSDNALGPYNEHPDTVLKSSPLVKGPGHHALFTDMKGHDWIVYHGWDTAYIARYPRIDRLYVTPDGLHSNGPTSSPQSIKK